MLVNPKEKHHLINCLNKMDLFLCQDLKEEKAEKRKKYRQV